MSDFEKASYQPVPELSPYVTNGRYENPKELFKQALAKLKTLVGDKDTLDLVDLGCANGEFLYYVRQNFPRWNLTGFDFTEQFIQTGREFEGLAGITLETKDFFTVEENFDIVCCFGTCPIFPDIEKPLEKLLSICRDGGIIICDGLFNKFDVEVRTVFCDSSKPEFEGIWHQDFNQHSRKRLRRFLEGKVAEVEFEDLVMGVELLSNPDDPHTNVWTFRDEDGRVLITNGMNMILNSTIMTIRK